MQRGTMAIGLIIIGGLAGALFTRPSQIAATSASGMPAAGSRVGYVNLYQLDKRYKRMFDQADEARKKLGQMQGKLGSIKQDVDRKKHQHDLAPADQKASANEVLIAAQRAFEDAEREMKKEIEAIWSENLVSIHRDLYETIQEVAKEKEIDVVNGFPGPIAPGELLKGNEKTFIEWYLRGTNINLLYLAKGTDLTDEVIERLNTKYAATKK